MIFVIDISNWQGNVNSSLWLPMNVHGAIAKALEGKTGIDKQWANNRAKLAQLKGSDFVPGAYHYMNHTYPAGDQCKAFLDLVPGDWIHALDVEGPGPLDVDGWFNEYRKHYPNKTVLLYTNEPMWHQISKVNVTDAATRYGPCEIWIAGAYRGAYQAGTDDFRKIWSRVPAGADGGLPQLGFDNYALMQYTGSATVPGVAGDCDMSVAGSIDILKLLAAENGVTDDMSQADVDAIKAYIDSQRDDIARAVWGTKVTSNWNGTPETAGDMLARAEQYAIEAGYPYNRPVGNQYPNSPTHARMLQASLATVTGQTDTIEASLAALSTAEADNPSLAEITQLLNDKLGSGDSGQLSKQDVIDAVQAVVGGTRFVPEAKS